MKNLFGNITIATFISLSSIFAFVAGGFAIATINYSNTVYMFSALAFICCSLLFLTFGLANIVMKTRSKVIR